MMCRRIRVCAPLVVAIVLAGCAADPPAPAAATTTAEAQRAALDEARAHEAEAALAAAQAEAAARQAPPASPQTKEAVEAEVGAGARPRPVPAAVPVSAVAAEASPFIFNVVSEAKSAAHPFFGVGDKTGFTVNGVPGKDLILVRGKTYSFKVDTGIQHDFYISSSKTGWGGATYSEGVKGNFIYEGVLTFTPSAATPDLLYYQCRNHKSMGGRIHVVSEGEEGKVRLAEPAETGAPAAQAPDQAQALANQVKQKISFADMYINKSETARRITGSGRSDALEKYRAAQARYGEAQQAAAGGDDARALALVDEALRVMGEAARAAPAEADEQALRQRYNELLDGTKTYEASYERNYQAMVKKKGHANVRAVDLERIRAQVAQARDLAGAGRYGEANNLLTAVQGELTAALTEILAQESISYELVFDTPKEEYEHELARYRSYEELIPLAIEQKRPPQETVVLMDRFVEKARGIYKLSEAEAQKENFSEAILMLQGATSHIERALGLIGVR